MTLQNWQAHDDTEDPYRNLQNRTSLGRKPLEQQQLKKTMLQFTLTQLSLFLKGIKFERRRPIG